MRLSAIPEAQRAEVVSQFNARFGEMERVLWKIRTTAALAVVAVLAGALAGCETPRDRDARICATAADPVAIANQAGVLHGRSATC